MKKNKIIIGGGGTGGHVFPAISIADALTKLLPEAEILFVGAQGRLEMEKVPEEGYKIIGLPVAGLQRKFTVKNLCFPVKLMHSMMLSSRIVRDFKPDVAIGVGGYASGPILRVASNKNIPVLIQEQNSYAGITNRMLASRATKIFVAYEGMEKYFPAGKIIFTGNPVRPGIIECNAKREAGLRYFDLNPTRKTILALGGSLGAGTINRSILNALDNIDGNVQLLWQSGRHDYEFMKSAVIRSGKKNIKILPFIKNIELAYGAADIIISRAGAGTISELAIVGKPVLLVPSPNVAEDHQTKNAMALVKINAAIHIPDKNAGALLLKESLNLIKDTDRMKQLSENIKKMAVPNASERIAKEIIDLL